MKTKLLVIIALLLSIVAVLSYDAYLKRSAKQEILDRYWQAVHESFPATTRPLGR